MNKVHCRIVSAVLGVYKLNKGTFNSADIYCDMNTTTNGGWIVIQRNKKDTLVNFNKNWTDYEKGFGQHLIVLFLFYWYFNCFTEK